MVLGIQQEETLLISKACWQDLKPLKMAGFARLSLTMEETFFFEKNGKDHRRNSSWMMRVLRYTHFMAATGRSISSMEDVLKQKAPLNHAFLPYCTLA